MLDIYWQKSIIKVDKGNKNHLKGVNMKTKKEKNYLKNVYQVGLDMFCLNEYKKGKKKTYIIFISQRIENSNEYQDWDVYYQTTDKKEAIAKFESVLEQEKGVAIWLNASYAIKKLRLYQLT